MALIPCNCLFNWFLLDEDLSLDLSILGRSESSIHSFSLSMDLTPIYLVSRALNWAAQHPNGSAPVTGNPLRICFVFKKPRESEVVVPQVPQEDRVCSTSGTEISSSVSGHDENLLPASLDSDKTTVLSESKKRKNIRQAKNPGTVHCLMNLFFLVSPLKKTVATAMTGFLVMNLQKPGESCFPSSQFLSEKNKIFSSSHAFGKIPK
ncbi:hypothetical protein Bca101_048286 [Brassica carinata]